MIYRSLIRKVSTIHLLLMLFIVPYLHAESAGQTAAKFLEFSPSVRGTGMGESSVALLDIFGMSWNPARIAFIKYKQAGFHHSSMYQENGLDVLTGAIPLKKKYALGLNVLMFGIPEEPVYDWSGEETHESISYSGSAMGIAGAYRVKNNISVGVNLKTIEEDICGYKDSAFASDVGAIYVLDLPDAKLYLALAFCNLGGAIRENEELTRIQRAGASYIRKELTATSELSIVDGGDITNVKLGAEYLINNTFAPRIGFKTGEESSIRGGFGLKWKGYNFDYAFSPNEALGTSHSFGAGVKFGYKEEKKKAKSKKETVKEKARPVVKIKRDQGMALNIAVAELDGKNVSAMDAAIVSDFIRTELVKTQAFKVLDRQNMERILAEQSFQMTGCTTEECAVQMGKILNVKYMAVGSFSKFLETYYININFIDVETGQIVGAESEECASGRELPVAANKIASAFAEQFGN